MRMHCLAGLHASGHTLVVSMICRAPDFYEHGLISSDGDVELLASCIIVEVLAGVWKDIQGCVLYYRHRLPGTLYENYVHNPVALHAACACNSTVTLPQQAVAVACCLYTECR